MFGDVSSSPFSFEKRGANRLNTDIMFLRYFEDSLGCEVITYFLHESFKVMIIIGDGDFFLLLAFEVKTS